MFSAKEIEMLRRCSDRNEIIDEILYKMTVVNNNGYLVEKEKTPRVLIIIEKGLFQNAQSDHDIQIAVADRDQIEKGDVVGYSFFSAKSKEQFEELVEAERERSYRVLRENFREQEITKINILKTNASTFEVSINQDLVAEFETYEKAAKFVLPLLEWATI